MYINYRNRFKNKYLELVRMKGQYDYISRKYNFTTEKQRVDVNMRVCKFITIKYWTHTTSPILATKNNKPVNCSSIIDNRWPNSNQLNVGKMSIN